ncbi:MAG: hypothetical protein QW568_03535 [Candidatus Anstonellaceae archaeon]
MSRTIVFLAVLLLAFSVGVAYAFSGGGGGDDRARGGDDGSLVTGAPPNPPADNPSGRMEKERRDNNGMKERANERMAAKAKMMYKLRDRVLECGNESTVRERVQCRLKLAQKPYEGLRHVPEECREKDSDDDRKECFELYDRVQPCRNLTTNEEKFACVRMRLNKTGNIASEFRGCQASQNPTACMALAKEKIHYEAKFKIYNLEHAAEKLMNRGVSNETITEFIVKLEQFKVDFDAASTKEEKKAVLEQVRAAWQEFKRAAIAEIKAAKGKAPEGNSTEGEAS